MTITLKHPEFGYVKFSRLTIRQRQVLEEYLKLKGNAKKTKITIPKG